MFQRIGVQLSTAVSVIVVFAAILGGYLILSSTDSQLDILKKQGQWTSIIGAKSVSTILGEIIDAGGLSRDDLFDSQFIPVENTSPQQYRTKYDDYVSKVLAPFEAEYLQHKDIVYARVIDLNGYVPVRSGSAEAEMIDDSQSSGIERFGKQILMDDRTTRVSLNKEKGFAQNYIDAKNRTIWEFASPIFVKEERWGSFCVGFKDFPERGNNSLFSPKQFLLGSIIIVLTVAAIFFIILKIIAPLSELLKMANDVADGKLDRPVKMENMSEIGKLADVIERLRVSTKMAIDRLAKNG
ncbi:MAG: hypothetical protein HKP58_18675 [Desulfatitalea sp.]|nr:hypothetical protein [Desulfatitalea sp.]NNK02441.1 hypothetical protein [Desulfatitalea sp.]